MNKKFIDVISLLKSQLIAERFILTGSCALNLQGWPIKTKDIDIILIKPSEGTIEMMKNLAKDFPPKRKGEYETPDCYRWTQPDGDIEVDVWVLTSAPELLVSKQGFEINSLPRIVYAKKRINRFKDWVLLRYLSSRIFSVKDMEREMDLMSNQLEEDLSEFDEFCKTTSSQSKGSKPAIKKA